MIDIAEDAIERATPLKPDVKLGISGKPEYECHNCGDTIDNGLYEFCPWCGQAIKW